MRAPAMRYAHPGRRLLALLIDTLLLLFLLRLLHFLPLLLDPTLILASEAPTPAVLPWPLLLLAAMLLSALLWNCCSGTPGKLLAGVRVVAVGSGAAPGVAQGLLRFAGYALSLLPAALGLLWILRDKRNQGFHDKLSRTLVIEDDESGKSLDQLLREAA
jgi:uncharacterized RDD family membrane protein YckC